MASAGCKTVELGIQSFNENALALAGRYYSEQTCLDACAAILEAGMEVGGQLMPGMPGVDEKIFLGDVRKALLAGSSCLRFYPCLVIGGTALEKMWRAGSYAPWSIERTINTLAVAWFMAQKKHVPVIRMGIAPQRGFEEKVVAGPAHNCLGARIMGKALYLAARAMINNKKRSGATVAGLCAPRHSQGYFWGWKNELEKKWNALGISRANLQYWQNDSIRVL